MVCSVDNNISSVYRFNRIHILLLNDIGVEKDIVTQENDKGYNNYIGRDGSVANGETNNYYH